MLLKGRIVTLIILPVLALFVLSLGLNVATAVWAISSKVQLSEARQSLQEMAVLLSRAEDSLEETYYRGIWDVCLTMTGGSPKCKSDVRTLWRADWYHQPSDSWDPGEIRPPEIEDSDHADGSHSLPDNL